MREEIYRLDKEMKTSELGEDEKKEAEDKEGKEKKRIEKQIQQINYLKERLTTIYKSQGFKFLVKDNALNNQFVRTKPLD